MRFRAFVVLVSVLMVPCLGCSTDSPEPAPAPLPMPAPEDDTLFYDDFDDVKPEWQQAGGVWDINDGWLIQRTDDPRQLNAIKFIQTPRVSDATVETVLRIAPDRPSQWTDSPPDKELARNIRYIIGAGIVFRMKDPDNFYMFRLAGEEGAVLGKMVDGEWIDIENPRVKDFLRGERIGFWADNEYRLKVEVGGSRFVCYINEEPVVSAKDDDFDIGHVGLITFKTAADFDFIKITKD